MAFVAVAAPSRRATSLSTIDPASDLFTRAFAGSSSFSRLASDTDISAARALVRDWYRIMSHGIAADGRCKACGEAIVGRFDGETPALWPRRIPVWLTHFHD